MIFKRFWLILPCFFPWLGSSFNSFDLQPWNVPYLLFLLFIFDSYDRRFFLVSLASFTAILLIQGFSFDNKEIFSFVKGISEFFLLFFSFIVFLQLKPKELIKIASLVNLVYLLIGLAQSMYGIDLFSSIVEVRTSSDRGVTSLTPEPTFFGLILLIFLCFHLFFSKNNSFILLNILGIVFLAKSASAIVLIPPLVSLWAFYCSKRKFIIFSILGFIGLYLLTVIDIGRATYLLNNSTSLIHLIEKDFSILIRTSDLISAPLMFWHHYFIPIPFQEISLFREYTMSNYFDGIFAYHSLQNNTNSYLGGMLVGGGIFFVMYLFFVLQYIKFRNLTIFFAICLVFIFSLPLGTVFFPYLLATLITFYKEKYNVQ
jgi:hypothetical protein